MSLYAHQKGIIDADPKRAGLFLGTGSGKTRTALILAKGSTLVIMPKTQYDDRNWERELDRIAAAPIQYDKQVRTITCISKEAFRRDHATLPAFDTVIVDEAHTCLGLTPNTRFRKRVEIPKASQLFEALEEYLDRTLPTRIYLCTATIMKSPMTVLAAGLILGKSPRGITSFYEFRRDFYTKLPMPGREVYAPKRDEETKRKLAEMVRGLGYVGRLEDYFDVPDQTFRTEHIELGEAQKKRIKELPLEYPEPIVRIGKRHQVENGVLAGDGFSAAESFPSGKIDRIVELAAEFPRMVVFARYTAQIAAIEAALRKAGYTAWSLTGDTTNRGHLIRVAQMNDGVLVVQAQISAGWELPETPVMVFASRTYSFVDYDQALGRIQRVNAIKKNLYISLVVKGGIDEAVDKALANKSDFNEKLYAEKGS